MKNHKIIDGRLIQTNKKFSQLKQSQKSKINEWLYHEYRKTYDSKGKPPGKQDKDKIISVVYNKIEKATIWLPLGELYGYYEAHINKFRKYYERGKKPAMNETIKTLTTRKSCRSYKDEHITREEIDIIISAGLNSPSGMNLQTPRFVVVQNDEMVEKLSKMNANVAGMTHDPFYGAKDIIIVLAKKECTYIYDGSLAMGNLMNAAWGMGIDSRWIHRAKEVFETAEGKELLKKWGITDEVEGIGFCILGHALEEKEKTEIIDGRVYYLD